MKPKTNIPKPVQEFQETIFNMSKAHGLDTISSCIIAYLSIQTTEVTLEELTKHTGYSLASISTATKALIRMKLINKNKKPGSKKLYLTGNQNPVSMMEEKIHLMKEQEISEQKNKLPKIIKELKIIIKKEKNKDQKKQYKEQLKIIEKHSEESEFMMHIMGIIEDEINKRKMSK